MELIKIGRIVNTHGIKGEIRIISNFPYKNQIFTIDNTIYIDNKAYIIKTYRKHKNFDMITLNNFTNINEVLFLMNKDVYYDKNKLLLKDNEVLDSDLINYKVLTKDKKIGIIKEIFYASSTNKILRILLDKEILIPFNSPQIIKIDKEKQELIIEVI